MKYILIKNGEIVGQQENIRPKQDWHLAEQTSNSLSPCPASMASILLGNSSKTLVLCTTHGLSVCPLSLSAYCYSWKICHIPCITIILEFTLQLWF